MRLVVGLRNPGSSYEGTRHNVGGEVLSTYAIDHGLAFKRAPRGIRADISETGADDGKALLAIPRTYMNESGQAIAPLMHYFDVAADNLLVVHDDIDLALATIRVQFGRGSGGNNGVRSMITSIRTRDFWRLRMGIGRPPGAADAADHVLARFTKAERNEMDVVVRLATDVVTAFIAAGGEQARQVAGELNAAGTDQ